MKTEYDYLIVGAGLYGITLARSFAEQGAKILMLEKRDYIGGNCSSATDPATGIEYHRYGTHIFHTDNEAAWDFVNRFDSFVPIQHRVDARIGSESYPLPFTIETFEKFFQTDFTAESLKEFLESNTIKYDKITNLEQLALSSVGENIYKNFILGYNEKQWGKKCKDLPTSILSRIPIRFDRSRDYFHRSKYQGLPKNGYQKMFESMVDHPNIEIKLRYNFLENRSQFSADNIIYTGPIDAYFNYQFGKLEWRSVEFVRYTQPYPSEYQTSVVNFPTHEVEKTRTHIPRLLYPPEERDYQKEQELCIDEYSCAEGVHPSYPIRTKQNIELLQKYQELAKKEANTEFLGRLAQYAYIDMDQTILSALSFANRQ